MKFVKSIVVVVCILCAGAAYAERREADYFARPQIGLWFGPVTPVFDTNQVLDTNLGGGLFFRYNTPYRPLKMGIDGSYQYFPSKGVNSLAMWPVYGSLLYRIPIKFALMLQLKAGAGGSHMEMKPDGISQWEPMFTLGFEGSFPAGRIINIGFRIDYIYVYEGYIKGAQRGGHIVNTGITLFFNVGGK